MKISYNSSRREISLATRFSSCAKAEKLSQKEMAAQLQVQGYYFSELTILRIEKGKRLVTDIELKILLRLFPHHP